MGNATSTKQIVKEEIQLPNYIDEMQFLIGHEDIIKKIVLIGQGRFASGSDDGEIRIWEIFTGKCLLNWHAHDYPVTSILALNSDILVTGDSNGNVKIWNSNSAQKFHSSKPHCGSVKSLCIINQSIANSRHRSNSNGNTGSNIQFISVGNDATIAIFDSTGSLLYLFSMMSIQDNIHCAIFASENHVIVAADSPLLYVYSLPNLLSSDMITCEQRSHDQLLGSQHRDSIQSLCRISNNLFASASLEGVIVVWKDTMQGYGRIRVLLSLNHGIPAVVVEKCISVRAMTRLGSNLLAVAIDINIVVFDSLKGTIVLEIPQAHLCPITCLQSLYSNHVLISSSIDASIRLWNVSALFGVDLKQSKNTASSRVRLEPVSDNPQKKISSIQSSPTNSLIFNNSLGSPEISNIVPMGIVSIADVLMSDLVGHTSSVSCLLKANEYSFVSADESGLLIMWKDGRFTAEIKNILCSVSFQNIACKRNSTFLEIIQNATIRTDAPVFPPLNCLAILPQESTMQHNDGPILGCSCCKCTSNWCPACVSNFIEHPPNLDNDSDVLSYKLDPAFSSLTRQHDYPGKILSGISNDQAHAPKISSLSLLMCESPLPNLNSPLNRHLSAYEPLAHNSSKRVSLQSSPSCAQPVSSPLALNSLISPKKNLSLTPHRSRKNSEGEYVLQNNENLFWEIPDSKIAGSPLTAQTDLQLREAVEIAREIIKDGIELSIDEICFELRAHGFSDFTIKSVSSIIAASIKSKSGL